MNNRLPEVSDHVLFMKIGLLYNKKLSIYEVYTEYQWPDV